MQPVEGITELLVKWSNGDKSGLDELMPLVYDELRRLARGYLRRQRQNHTLQPTALVNEAYLRLIGQRRVSLQNRAQFFGLAAKAMRAFWWITLDAIALLSAAARITLCRSATPIGSTPKPM